MNQYDCQRSRSFIDLGSGSLRFNIFKLLFLEIARPIEAKFHVEPPWGGRMKVCSNGPGHTTNIADMLIWQTCSYIVKTLKKFSLEPNC